MTISSYPITKRLPISATMKLADKDIGGQETIWKQNWLPIQLNNFFIGLCPCYKTLFPSVLIHTITNDVPLHRDRISKSVFVIPIKVGKNTILNVEDKSVVMKKGRMYKFNDFNWHSVSNSTNAKVVLITVSFEPC